ncbi:MAG TPA: PBP1A family penicillin-binding protein, partial [Thermopetrobacter sp.]|nr:PBP1A family penicillin-binding protein [Thermopetrobacter sp.]
MTERGETFTTRMKNMAWDALARVWDAFYALDSRLSAGAYEAWDALRRAWLAYDSFLQRFRVTGIKRFVVGLLDDGLSFALAIAFVLVAFAVPPFSGEGDVWNMRRQYAVTITDVNGEIVGRRGIRQNDAVPFSEIPQHLIKAVLATEDTRFYDHFGVDVIGTLRAAIANAQAKGVVQGGSSITQQLAKNLFLTPERSFRRKIHEAFLALWIEARLSKDEILKLYLERAYMGAGAHGVEAAAQFYFGRSVRDINLKQAAVLAGLFKAPTKFAPHLNPENAEKRATVVLYRMLKAGFISHGELMAARAQPLEVIKRDEQVPANYFLDYVYQETLDILKRHNLTQDFVVEVRSTLEPRIQKLAEDTVIAALEQEGKLYRARQGALVSMTPDGALKAIVGGRDYEKSQFNRATDALRQPGSAFKPFVYLAALMNGYKPLSRITDAPITIRGWTPQNYSRRYHGKVTLLQALTHSYNTVPVRLMTLIGRQTIIDVARRAGLKSRILPVPSMPLGSNEVTVLDLTTAYAAFANGGKRVSPYSVLEIRRPDGTLIYRRDKMEPRPKQTLPAGKVAQLNTMLANVVANGTARRAQLGFTPQAGKTGTTSSYRDAWFMGITGHLVTGVWFGNDNYTPTNKLTGGRLPAQTWQRFMDQALLGRKPLPLPGLPVSRQHLQVAQTRPGLTRPAAARPAARAQRKLAALDDAGGASLQALTDADILTPAAVRIVTPGARRERVRRLSTGGQQVRIVRPGNPRAARRKRRSGSVAGALRNVFGLFRVDNRRRQF